MKKIKSKINAVILLLPMLCFSNFLLAQDVFKGTVIQPTAHEQELLEKQFKHQTLITFDVKSLHDFVRKHPEQSVFTLQIGNQLKWVIDLQENELRSPDFREEQTGENGTISIPRGECITYKGFANGTFSGETRLNIEEHRISGVIFNKEQNIYIESIRNYDRSLSFDKFIVYASGDVIPSGGTCGGGTIADAIESANIKADSTIVIYPTPTCRKIEVAAELDYEAYNSGYGNSDVVSNLNLVQAIYANTWAADLTLVYSHSWTTVNDPYTSFDACQVAGSRLDQFKNYWNANYASVERDIAILYTDIVYNGVIIGCANKGVFGNGNASDDYGTWEWFSNTSKLCVLAAHEIGHIFGASHDANGCNGNGNIMCPVIDDVSWSSPFFNWQADQEVQVKLNLPLGEAALRNHHFGAVNQYGSAYWSNNTFNLDGAYTLNLYPFPFQVSYLELKAVDYIDFTNGFSISSGTNKRFYGYIGPCDLNQLKVGDNPGNTASQIIGEPLEVKVAPNPFNDAIAISVTLYDDAQVSMLLFDNTGRLITTVLNGKQLLSGTQTVDVNTSKLTPGVYYLKVQTGDKLAVKKVVKI